MRKKILITGSCSFILSNFLRKCIFEKMEASFVSFDKTNDETIHSMYWNKNHQFMIADVTDKHIVSAIIKTEKPDIIIHGAAETSVDQSLIDSSKFLETNVLGTECLVRAAVDNKVSRFYYLSTSQVYGNQKSILNPKNPYSLSKHMGEQLVLQANLHHSLSYIITRSSHCYGQRQTKDKFVPKIINSILQKEPIIVYGDGSTIKEWMYVGDHSSAIIDLLIKDVKNEIVNVGSNQEYSLLEVVNKITTLMNEPQHPIEFRNSSRVEDDNFSMGNSIVPCVKMRDGLEATISWYLANKWWFSTKS